MKKVFETDWLASTPIFYNELSGQASYNINDVIDFANFEFHPEGFNNYLDFGYSILGQTPIKHVKFLRHSARLTTEDDGQFRIEHFDDPIDAWVGKTSREDDVFHLLQSSMNEWERSVDGNIIVPTSGGYDSRLLNWFIEDKSRIRAFTYGVSENQMQSHEVVYGQKIAELLGIRWERIPLGDFHLYFDQWNALFGVATHAHGMYHIEFFAKILPKIQPCAPFLSGILGGTMAGVAQHEEMHSPADLLKLGYTHGMRADPGQSLFKTSYELRQAFWEENRKQLQQTFYQVMWRMRIRVMLLSYLMTVPQSFGLHAWSPYLLPDIGLSMATLPEERRRNRVWQKEYFQQHGLLVESLPLKGSLQNNLNYQAMRRVPLKPLDVSILREVVRPEYVNWINRHVGQQGFFLHHYYSLRRHPDMMAITRRLHLKETRLQAYCAYLCLKPIETILKKRQALQRS